MTHATGARRAAVFAANVAIAGFVLAAPASADNDGWVLNGYLAKDDYNFLVKLRDAGVHVPLPTGALVQSGHAVCNNLRRGVKPDDQQAARYIPTAALPQIIAAAQTELCPDTLR